jgi:hypothetical protein
MGSLGKPIAEKRNEQKIHKNVARKKTFKKTYRKRKAARGLKKKSNAGP